MGSPPVPGSCRRRDCRGCSAWGSSTTAPLVAHSPWQPPFNSHHRWLTEATSYSRDGRLVLLPTTCSLGQWFKWRRRTVIADPPDYQMVYLHDYDLLASRTRLMLDGVLETPTKTRWRSTRRELATDFSGHR